MKLAVFFEEFYEVFKDAFSLFTHPLFYVQGRPMTLLGILLAIILLFGSYWLSRLIQYVLRERVLFRLDKGAVFAIIKIVHYTFMVLIFFLVLGFVGINLSSVAVLLGFLGIGIGFGLQNIVANFIAGLVLLIERPVKIGDRVTVGAHNGDVTNISLRATTIRTRDNIAIIVPNSSLLSNDVINWSHGDPRVRVHVRVPVSYHADVKKVTELLLQIAKESETILEVPSAKVWFVEFGESALIFELLVWIRSAGERRQLISDLNYRIREAFITHQIEIPFPQRVIHLQKEAA
ncbi:MAG: mechanosensitive ion channel [Deltaproteobacteria bacterium]|nr:mechanosensitive ion channel [Deltaproteobacteria bacterium]